eukprot:XP_011428984.1 PREDICTED: uncharacterized protein LOC105329433 isoform X1 [Crassostrea gigas]
MASKETKENIKKVQQTLDTFKKKQQDIQENLKKLESKKDKDAKPIMETLYEQLRETEQLYQQALGELKDVQEDLGKKLGKKEDKPESQEPSRSERSPSRKLNLSPDEQEMTYELKAQLMRNIEMQNQKLKTELTLHEKMNESKLLNQQNRKLHEDSTLSRTNTLRLMKMFEKKAKDADEKLKEMQRELHKSQQLTKKYQQLLELEKRKLGGVGSGHVTPVSTGDEGESPRVPHPSSYSLLGGNVRVNDIIRKNEVLIEENGNLRREIQRLKQDNATLIKKTKHAMSDKDEIIKRIQTLGAENARMQNQLCKERSQHNMLSRSLTRQASDWIMLKKQLAQFDEEYKWSQVVNARTRTPKSQYGSTAYLPSRATNKDGKTSASDWTSVYKSPGPRQRSVMEMSVASSKNPREYSMLSEVVKVPKPPKREKSKLLPII